MKKEHKIYVQGGFYPTHKHFGLVKPTNGLPYIWKDPQKAKHLTQHHSHSYLVNDDLKTLTLVEESWEANNVGAPKEVTLVNGLAKELKDSIDRNLYYD